MNTYQLEKKVKLFKNQFDKLSIDIYQDYRLDRTSLEMDSLLFRMKYMYKRKKDLDEIPKLREEFKHKSIKLRDIFVDIVFNMLDIIVQYPDGMDCSVIHDILAQDVKIDQTYVSFTLILISDNEEYLKYIDEKIPENDTFNIFPNEYFRFTTDSYNDAIAKAYPELFENRHQDKIGTGNDADVFVHNFTFQTTERCSLNCFTGDTRITMFDGSRKLLKDIQVGDELLGFPEKGSFVTMNCNLKSVVTNVVKRTVKRVVKLTHPYIGTLYVTPEHRFATIYGRHSNIWMPIQHCVASDYALLQCNNHQLIPFYCYEREIVRGEFEVYDITTTTHTFFANSVAVHNCTYCYQVNKTPMRMEFDTAKKFIDKLLNDEYGYINRYNSPAIIIEFIGGEPLLEIDLTRQIYEYFLDQCYELNHPWFHLHRISICSNGLAYFDENAQSFFKDYASNISFNISIDGNKELHDACRIQPNGEGSYDIAMAALNHFNEHYTSERNSKMTLAPSNISYLFDSVVDFINNGMTTININCVFEEGWTRKTAHIEYEQLKKLAEYIIANDLEHIYIAIFNDRQEDMMPKENDGSFCGGGSGSMLAMRPNGQFYPCIRYMPSSVGDDEHVCIGDIDQGIIGRDEGSEILKQMDENTRRAQNNDICYECPLSNDCASCAAHGYQIFGSLKKRANFICIQMIAEALANYYYWNMVNIKYPEYGLNIRKNNVPDEWALLVIGQDELDFLKKIEILAIDAKLYYESNNK